MGRSVGASVYNKAAAIASGQTASAAIDLRDFMLAGITMPAAFTGTALTFQVATPSGGSYTTLEDENGDAYTLTVEASKYYPVNVIHFVGGRFLKIVSGSAEGADRTLTLHLIPRSVQPNDQVLFAAHNLSDLVSASIARTNLGVARGSVSQRIQYTDLTDPTPATINIGSALPAGAVVIGHEVKLDAQFVGGSMSVVTLSVGVAADVDSIVNFFNIKGATAGGKLYAPGYTHAGGHADHCTGNYDAAQLIATVRATGDTFAHLTAGDLTITVWYLVL
jgi:hypothetical protein